MQTRSIIGAVLSTVLLSSTALGVEGAGKITVSLRDGSKAEVDEHIVNALIAAQERAAREAAETENWTPFSSQLSLQEANRRRHYNACLWRITNADLVIAGLDFAASCRHLLP
jgi:hypothetical protein